jgi:hypothetical protein
MASSGMLRRVALVRTEVSEELITSIIRVIRIGGKLRFLQEPRDVNIPEDTILHSHHRVNLKSSVHC